MNIFHKIYLLLATAVLFAAACNNGKATSESTRAMSLSAAQLQTMPKIYVCTGSETVAYRNFLKTNNIQQVKFANDAQFLDRKVKYRFDPALLRQEISRSFPNASDSGMAYIDIENPYMDELVNANPNSAEYKKSLKLFLDVLAFAKKERPNVKWGFYAIPYTSYWDRTPAFYNKHYAAAQIIKNSDVLFPSIYIFYNYVNFDMENKDYIKENTREMIRIADMYKKPVIPMIMSRYHPSNEKVRDQNISDKDFKNYVSIMMNTNYNGKKLDGILLWNRDEYGYRIKYPIIMDELQKSKKGFDQFYDDYLIRYLKIMITARTGK